MNGPLASFRNPPPENLSIEPFLNTGEPTIYGQSDVEGNTAFFNNLFVKGQLTTQADPFVIGRTLRFDAEPSELYTTDLIAEKPNYLAIRGPSPANTNGFIIYGYYDPGPPIQYERCVWEQLASTAHLSTENNDGTGVELIIETQSGYAGDPDCPISIQPASNSEAFSWVFHSNNGSFGPQNPLDIVGVRSSGAQNFVSTTGGFQFNPTQISPANTLRGGIGVPASALGVVGDTYFRSDTPATSLQRIYVKTGASTWVGIA